MKNNPDRELAKELEENEETELDDDFEDEEEIEKVEKIIKEIGLDIINYLQDKKIPLDIAILILNSVIFSIKFEQRVKNELKGGNT